MPRELHIIKTKVMVAHEQDFTMQENFCIETRTTKRPFDSLRPWIRTNMNTREALKLHGLWYGHGNIQGPVDSPVSIFCFTFWARGKKVQDYWIRKWFPPVIILVFSYRCASENIQTAFATGGLPRCPMHSCDTQVPFSNSRRYLLFFFETAENVTQFLSCENLPLRLLCCGVYGGFRVRLIRFLLALPPCARSNLVQRMASHHRGKEAAAGPSRSKRSRVQPAHEGPFFEGEMAESEDEAAEAGSGYYEQFSSSGDGKSHRGSFTVENLADIQRSVQDTPILRNLSSHPSVYLRAQKVPPPLPYRGAWFLAVTACQTARESLRIFLDDHGFKDFLRISPFRSRHSLVQALAERWFSETNTFHLGIVSWV
ncbi:uncharacterized protein LOC131309633 [Rhododendron vialii]|uniref:uncharacterized protein LOC131309633 n=1 Tax=Rhododendron vialii TaxID=182163 RepID=UPI00265E3854|nr:uncharacterized protein LOC131309633 [Rhododendron vialii]